VTVIDEAALGQAMHDLAAELFPITRSLTGPGYRATLDRLERVSGPMLRHRFLSGERVHDWVVPPEWTIRDAWIKGPDGAIVVAVGDCNLHVVGYSTPVHATLGLAELQEHLHSLPEQPAAIPYRTSYYTENWGFCLADEQRRTLPDGPYEVLIDADLAPGAVELGEVVIEGTSDGRSPAGAQGAAGEVLLWTYCCHPSLANNELSGPVVAAHLAALLRERRPRHTYRIVFAPETIGAIAYLSRFGERLRERLVAGYVLTCAGDPGPFTYKRSRRGDSLADRVAEHVLRCGEAPHGVLDFVAVGSDERQFCSPGYDLPVGSLMRTMYGTYPEYHTSLDDLELITPAALGETLGAYVRIVDALEANETLVGTVLYGEPQLGRRGLYPATGGPSAALSAGHQRDIMFLLNFCDGTADLLAAAEASGRPLAELAEAADLLRANDLLRPA
jgi:aminopeptidase-like protein